MALSIARNVAIDSFRKQKGWKQKIMEKFDWSTQQVKDELPCLMKLLFNGKKSR